MNYAKCWSYLSKINTFIGKIRQEALNEDNEIIKMTDELYKIGKKINDYIYKKLP